MIYSGRYVEISLLTPHDAELYFEWMKWPGFTAYKPYLRETAPHLPDVMVHLSQQAKEPRVEYEVLVRRVGDHQPIGLMALSAVDPINQKAEFSAVFSQRHSRSIWEALHFSISRSFSEFNLYKMVFHVVADNHAVVRLLRHLGLHEEGRLQREILVDQSSRKDLLRFALFRDELDTLPAWKRLGEIVPLVQ